MSRRRSSTRARGARDASSCQHHHRRLRLEQALLAEVRALLREAVDPDLQGIEPVAVELSPDSGRARVPFTVIAPDGADELAVRTSSLEALARASGFFRARLASSLDLRKVPSLGFVFVRAVIAPEGGNSCPE